MGFLSILTPIPNEEIDPFCLPWDTELQDAVMGMGKSLR